MRNTNFLHLKFIIRMRYIFILMVCLFFFSNLQAQRVYDRALGGRFGYPFSLSYKTFISEANALEANIGFIGNRSGYNWVSVSGAYLHHKILDIESIDNLNWYFGGGASVIFWNFASSFGRSRSSGGTSFSVEGYIGIEYTFDDIPLNLSVDWRPSIFFNDFFGGFGGTYGALSVRYVLN